MLNAESDPGSTFGIRHSAFSIDGAPL